MRIMWRSILVLAMAGLGAGCTWVKSTAGADAVRIVPADRIADCVRIGTVSGFTKADVAGVKRKASKVQSEVETLARREAVEMGADTLVAEGQLKEGQQSFVAYRCLK
ncbi:MAG: DUF4156 domain-containing protein [Gammaproteobacteria bacterium]|nr:DUF4156 domain-containing protein [Gammaproteobacteria bacterium]